MLSQAAQGDPFTDRSPGGMLVRFAKGLDSWFWVVAVVGAATRLGRRGSSLEKEVDPAGEAAPHFPRPAADVARKQTVADRIARYAREAQLPYYVLHQTPIVVIGYYVVQWNTGTLAKFLVISLSSLVVTLVLYEIVVRRTAVTRFLFGMRLE